MSTFDRHPTNNIKDTSPTKYLDGHLKYLPIEEIEQLRFQLTAAALNGLLGNVAAFGHIEAVAEEAVRQADRAIFVLNSNRIGELK